MSGVFERSATMVRKSGMVIVVWLIAVTIMVIGAIYFCEDYMTSVKGYQMVPTRHHYDWIVWIGALTPQVGLVFFAYLGADQPNRWWAWFASLALLFVDSANDLLFKYIPGPGQGISLAASIVDIFVMYTLCSEGFLVLGSGLTLELFPDMIGALRNIKGRMARPDSSWGMLSRSLSRGRGQRGMGIPTQSRSPRSWTQEPGAGLSGAGLHRGSPGRNLHGKVPRPPGAHLPSRDDPDYPTSLGLAR